MTTTDTYPMPDTDCPTWCDRDHRLDWKTHVAVGLDSRRIPAAGGGYLPENRRPLSEWLELFEPLHVRTLGEIDPP